MRTELGYSESVNFFVLIRFSSCLLFMCSHIYILSNIGVGICLLFNNLFNDTFSSAYTT